MSESQKPTTKSYRDNWDAIWGKKECQNCDGSGYVFDGNKETLCDKCNGTGVK